jgi:hypothetical protein
MRQRVFIAQGSGVTVEYIIQKGSACVEAFHEISHLIANFFGDPDCARHSKEVAFHEDMRVLVEERERHHLFQLSSKGHFVPAPAKKTSKKTTTTPISAIVDVQVGGAEIWQQGKFSDFIKATTYDPALGYPIDSPEDHDTRLDTQTVFDNTISNPDVDVHGDESGESGIGSLGGGGEFSTGEIAM